MHDHDHVDMVTAMHRYAGDAPLPGTALHVVPVLFYCWTSIVDDGPTLKQLWVNLLCPS